MSIETSITHFTAEAARGRSAPAVTATMANGTARLTSGRFTFDADLSPALGGGNLAPSPTARCTADAGGRGRDELHGHARRRLTFVRGEGSELGPWLTTCFPSAPSPGRR
jgi:hypothetical protein